MATYQNFSISKKLGKFYLKEKQPTEGYTEVEYGTPPKKTYHKYFDTVQGLPTYFGTKEVEFDGRTLKFMELSLDDGEVVNKISVPLKNRGGYTDEVKALVSALEGYDVGEPVSIAPKRNTYTTKTGKDGENLNIYINYKNRQGADGKNESTGYIKFEEIPSPTSSIVAGDTVWDWTPQTQFYYDKIQAIEEKFKNASGDATPTVKSTTKPTTKKAGPITASPAEAFEPVSDLNDGMMDDLPFN